MAYQQRQNVLGQYASAGIQFTVTVILLTVGGVWLDYRLSTLPLWTLVGLAIGFAAGLYRLVRIAGELNRKSAPQPRRSEPDDK